MSTSANLIFYLSFMSDSSVEMFERRFFSLFSLLSVSSNSFSLFHASPSPFSLPLRLLFSVAGRKRKKRERERVFPSAKGKKISFGETSTEERRRFGAFLHRCVPKSCANNEKKKNLTER